MAVNVWRVFQIGRLGQTVLKTVFSPGCCCGKRCAGAAALLFGDWRRTGALTVAGLCLLGAMGARGQGGAGLFLWWNPSPTGVSYNLYYGTASRTYTNEQSVGNVTNATVSGLIPGTTYYFAATAVGATGEESVFSNEFVYSVPGVAPTMSSIPDQVADENSATGPLPFTVSDALVPASNLVVSATSSNLVLVPVSNILLGGSGTSRTVTVAPALGQVGSTLITLSVSDGAVSTNSSFVLTVTPLPGITLTSPLNGSGFLAPATITLAAKVISNGHAIAGVQFFNGATLLGQVSAPPYTLVWTSVSAGNYSVMASVTDELGSTATSTPALIAVTNLPSASAPPVVTLSSPTNGGIYLSPAILNLAANVISNGHTVDFIQYYNGGTYLATAFLPPYTLTWLDATPGTCALRCQIYFDTDYFVESSANTIDVIGLLSPWLNTDIGSPGAPGAAGQTNGLYLVSGAGTIGGLSDSFQFVYQPLSGDGKILAYLSSVGDTDSNGFAGVMIRESLASGSEYVALGVTPDGRVLWSTRANTGDLAVSDTSLTGAPPAGWLCLVLRGSTCFGLYSADGVNWTPMGLTSINMGSNTYAGLAVSSGLPNLLNASSFDPVYFNEVVADENGTTSPSSSTDTSSNPAGSTAPATPPTISSISATPWIPRVAPRKPSASSTRRFMTP